MLNHREFNILLFNTRKTKLVLSIMILYKSLTYKYRFLYHYYNILL